MSLRSKTMDHHFIFIGICLIAMITGIIIYLMLPRALEQPQSDVYMYGRHEVLVGVAIFLMFGGAFGTVALVAIKHK